MTQLYIPALRARFVLMEDWTFPLYDESRNSAFASFMKVEFVGNRWSDPPVEPVDVTVPKGTVMYIDRYYIKNGGREHFNSITLRAWFGKNSQRFWVKLDDANRIQADFLLEFK